MTDLLYFWTLHISQKFGDGSIWTAIRLKYGLQCFTKDELCLKEKLAYFWVAMLFYSKKFMYEQKFEIWRCKSSNKKTIRLRLHINKIFPKYTLSQKNCTYFIVSHFLYIFHNIIYHTFLKYRKIITMVFLFYQIHLST